MLCVQFRDALHSYDESVVDDVKGLLGLESLGGGRSDVLELHVQDGLRDLFENGVCGQHFLCNGLRGGLVLSINVVAFQDLPEVHLLVVNHMFSSYVSSESLPTQRIPNSYRLYLIDVKDGTYIPTFYTPTYLLYISVRNFSLITQ